RTMAEHARRSVAGRPVYSADALGCGDRVGAHGGIARARSGRHSRDAHRSEWPPALAVLRELTRCVGERDSFAAACGKGRAPIDVATVMRNSECRMQNAGVPILNSEF